MKRDAVDFHAIPQHQLAMDQRLINWGRAQRNGSGQSCAPMFRQYRSSDQWEGATSSPTVDQLDAAKINKAWQQLEAQPRAALAWNYVTPSGPERACKEIGCLTPDNRPDKAKLASLVVQGRQALIDRRV